MVRDSLPSFKISPHPVDVSVIWGMATSMLRDIRHCHDDKKSMGFLLVFLTFKDICRKVDSICALLLAETKHLYGRHQARIPLRVRMGLRRTESIILCFLFCFSNSWAGWRGQVLNKLLLHSYFFRERRVEIYIQKQHKGAAQLLSFSH